MGVMPDGHAHVGVTKLLRDYMERYAPHRELASVGVAEDVKGDLLERRGTRRLGEPPNLVGAAPALSVGAREEEIPRGAPRRSIREEADSLVVEVDVTRRSGLALADSDCRRIGIEVAHLKCYQLAVPASGEQSGLNQRPKLGVTGIA